MFTAVVIPFGDPPAFLLLATGRFIYGRYTALGRKELTLPGSHYQRRAVPLSGSTLAGSPSFHRSPAA